MIGNIVRFCGNADQLAAEWCRSRDLVGKVVGEECDRLQVDVGLYYYIYARSDQLEVVGECGEPDRLPLPVQMTAPMPDDGY